ncbi:MAG: hypothetical protein V3T84_03545 [Phycisphaerales bacterium]
MINLSHIERLVNEESYSRLVDRVLSNGRRVNTAVAKRLRGPEAVAAAACGLALQRCCELTYAPTPLADRLAMRLLEMQRNDGHFSCSVAASAVALRGLLEYVQHHRDVGEAVDAQTSAGIAEGLAAFRRTQSADGGFRHSPVESTIVLWQLGGHEAFRSAVDLDPLWSQLERSSQLPLLAEPDEVAPAAA